MPSKKQGERTTRFVVAQRVYDALGMLTIEHDFEPPVYAKDKSERRGTIQYGTLGRLVGYEFTNDGEFKKILSMVQEYSQYDSEFGQDITARVVTAASGWPSREDIHKQRLLDSQLPLFVSETGDRLHLEDACHHPEQSSLTPATSEQVAGSDACWTCVENTLN